ncbi:HD domain-containing protein [Clostridium sp. WLY-B-L2]|uniref:HD domain-containing protein n=1 Tax=Clostridium aromativorans TaxID=2836848 RepID=A0ABS8N9R4_9CLOT|nr:HD domain-containing phosphohydrolase [Clostridium aromativorans]MCC9296546.1 HD domain-containing protein [Clostridium aromativorans]
MIKSYKSIFNSNNINTLLKNIGDCFNCDTISILNFNIDKNFVTLDKILDIKNNPFKALPKLSKINITNFGKSKLKLLFYNKEIIFVKNNCTTNFPIILENAEEELLIPIKSKNNLTTFIYMCSLDTNDNHINIDFINNDNFKYLLYSIINTYEMYFLSHEKNELIFELIYIMTEILKEKEPLMVFHPYNVADISKKIAIQLKLNYSSIDKIYLAGLLHDMGKLCINKNILNKTDNLTENEYIILKEHSIYGYNLLKNIYYDIAVYIKYHHEKIDGTGYPDNLKGDEIPLESKIISVADAIDAMYAARSYNTSKSLDSLVTELLHSADKKFDSTVVDAAIKVIIKSKNNSIYKLDNKVEWSTLTIKTSKASYSIDGILRKTDSEYIFKSNEFIFLNDINIADIQCMHLYICKNTIDIYQYKIAFNFFKENTLHIKEIHQIEFNNYFNLSWNLQGELIFCKFPISSIAIFKLGGDSLMFYCHINIKESLTKQFFNIKINFENDDQLIVSGALIQLFKSGSNYYYELKYVNILETVREEIFSRIFKKQAELNIGFKW